MDKEKKLPKRKGLRPKNFDYSTPGAYFVTICTHNIKCVLSRVVGAIHESPKIQLTEYGKIADRLINTIPRQSLVTIDRYVIMPNHIHLLIMITDSDELRRSLIDFRSIGGYLCLLHIKRDCFFYSPFVFSFILTDCLNVLFRFKPIRAREGNILLQNKWGRSRGRLRDRSSLSHPHSNLL